MTETPITTRREGASSKSPSTARPANAIDLATSRLMGETFRAFRDDPDLRVAILRAEGAKFFCAGWDLKAAAAGDAVDGDYGVGGFGGLQELPHLEQAGDRRGERHRLRRRARARALLRPDPGQPRTRPSPCPRSAPAPSPTPPR